MGTTRCEVTVDGPIARSLLALISSRFDRVSVPAAAVLVVEGIDQASVRALLILLWDAGHDVLSFTTADPGG